MSESQLNQEVQTVGGKIDVVQVSNQIKHILDSLTLFENTVVEVEQPDVDKLPEDVEAMVVVINAPFAVFNVVNEPDFSGVRVFVNPLNDAAAVAFMVAELMEKLIVPFKIGGVAAPLPAERRVSYQPTEVYAHYQELMTKASELLQSQLTPVTVGEQNEQG